jgi:phage terminase large subunit
MPRIDIPTARAFMELTYPARYLGAYSGRGAGKSHFFAELIVERCMLQRGTLGVCIREVQRTLAQSSKRLIETKIHELGLGSDFRVFHDRIEAPGDGLLIFQGMQDSTAESIKSLEGYDVAWVEEAQTLSHRSLALLRPTIRTEGSQIWFSWNPRRKTDAVDQFLREKKPSNAIVVKTSWRDNPWFTAELEAERQLDLDQYPERYAHIWEGDYIRATEGAYYAALLQKARDEGRIGKVAADPLLQYRACFDIGGAGAKADACAIWIVQWVDKEIRVLDYIEGQGQVLAYYTNELRERGYDRCEVYLPHDGVNTNIVTGLRYADHLRDAGFSVQVVRNQGMGAASQRVEAVRRILPRCCFDEAKCSAGLDALANYHEKRDEGRDIGLGPEHDWSSHAADAFGLMAVAWRDPRELSAFHRREIAYPRLGIA